MISRHVADPGLLFRGEGSDEIWRNESIARVHPKLWIIATAGNEEAQAGAFAAVFSEQLRRPPPAAPRR